MQKLYKINDDLTTQDWDNFFSNDSFSQRLMQLWVQVRMSLNDDELRINELLEKAMEDESMESVFSKILIATTTGKILPAETAALLSSFLKKIIAERSTLLQEKQIRNLKNSVINN